VSNASVVERLLRRDRAITLVALAALVVLAWFYILAGAGLGMSAREMTTVVAFPHRLAIHTAPYMSGMDMGNMTMPMNSWAAGTWALMVAMWWVMMIAMMAPSAAPSILLYASVHRHAVAQGQIQERFTPTGAFAAGYLSIWLAFAVGATALHWALEKSGLVAATLMGSQSRWLSSAILIAAGFYQFTPFKRACLSHCRAPALFLARHWRPGASGAFVIGALHGAYCVGCCWMLMALLFVGGVMNLVWIAALAILVLAEKTMRAGRWVGHGVGVALIAWGVTTLLI
jgi:predicted metal-binding membrane protein